MTASPADRAGLVHAAVERLYTTFRDYPPRPAMPVCAHCVTADEVVALLAQPPRSTEGKRLARYATKAVTTWGDADDLRRLLPRLCELAATGDDNVELGVVAAKLRWAGWLRWPPDEQAAVFDLLEALWLRELTGWPAVHPAPALVHAVAAAVDDLRPFLDEWHLLLGTSGSERDAAVHHLADLVTAWRPRLAAGTIGRRLSAWLRGPTIHIQLERAAFDFAGSSLGERARRAAEALAGNHHATATI
ncbi:MAG: hypothetical protein ACRD0U_20015 [Acidimicrobiales bacterium]